MLNVIIEAYAQIGNNKGSGFICAQAVNMAKQIIERSYLIVAFH